MTRFRPTVESLDARTLPSAVFAAADAPPSEAAALVDTSAPLAAGNEQSLSLNFPKITFRDTLVSGKVTVQDFHFTAKVNKASPLL